MGEITQLGPIRLGLGYVYMAADDDGSLLYVGSTNDILRRIHEHRRLSGWWPMMSWMSCAAVRTVDIARGFEARLIDDHRPTWNTRQVDQKHEPGPLFRMPDDANLTDVQAVLELLEEYVHFTLAQRDRYRDSMLAFDALGASETETLGECQMRLVSA